jgi:2-succinyl-6-hydroxy-2,4-cyclohexadiene-1-carboxylate synthase
LLLVGAGPGLADAGERAARRAADERLADEIEQSDIESFARRWALTPVLAGLPDALAARAHEDRLRNSPAALARALRGLGTGALPSLWERLGEVRVPVTLVVGERDARFRQIAQRMADALPAARVAVVPGAGHAVHLEAPRVVAGLLDELAKEPQ